MSDETETIYVTLVASTPKAILVDIGLEDKNFWVPRSLAECEDQLIDDLGEGESFELMIPEWFATKEGIC